MILRHMREPLDGQIPENTFEAVDERSGARLGACTISVSRNEELFPNRPVRIYLEIEGAPVPDALLGAAIARAKELGRQCKEPCRIFTSVDPADRARMDNLSMHGLKDSDGLVRMECTLPANGQAELPLGSVMVSDDLEDPIEQTYFLERYNQLYREENGSEWLAEFMEHEGFTRILLVNNFGMQGELIFWQENGAGMIAWLQTARKWRRKGIARCLLHLACAECARRGLKSVQAEVQARIPNMLHVLESCGFRQSELLLRYPGMDMN